MLSRQDKHENASKFLRKRSHNNLNSIRKWERYLSTKNKIQHHFNKNKLACYFLENFSLKL